jgi:hypothetical protein
MCLGLWNIAYEKNGIVCLYTEWLCKVFPQTVLGLMFNLCQTSPSTLSN